MITPAIGTNQLYMQLNILLQTNTPVFIHGSPGIGKSYIVSPEKPTFKFSHISS